MAALTQPTNLARAADPAPDPLQGITAELRARILAHGPWPLPQRRDRSNRVSGNAAAIAFGRKLFFDDGLSRFGALSCASCHKPDKAWGDGRAKASAAAGLDRNTPSLFNLRHLRVFGWDGGADSLWMQTIRPILDSREMAASPEHVREHVAGRSELASDYRRVFGSAPSQDVPERALVNVAKALAAFQETITTGRTPFDEFRDALANGDRKTMARYPPAARRGLLLFVDKGQCSTCHSGPVFTSQEFYDTGVAPGRGPIDTGRFGGLAKLEASPYTRLGVHSDERGRRPFWQMRRPLPTDSDRGAFRVPPLRNVAQTGPYMHNGSIATLADAVRHYTTRDRERRSSGNAAPLPLIDLDEVEIADLLAFLESLTATSAP